MIPWEERPAGCTDTVWRYSRNPIIGRDATPTSNSVLNSAVVPHGEKFAGVFRVDNRRREMRLHAGFSNDGVSWNIEERPIDWKPANAQIELPEYGYDPRVCWIEDRYWITWCNGFHGPAIGIGYTFDFQEFVMVENALLPYNRNGVLFPRRVNGKYMMLSRPSDNGHTPFGEIFISQSDDMVHWGMHRHVMKGEMPWESTKIGAGPVPIETPEGWLLIYHGVLTSCSGFVYHYGAALLDLDEPWKVRHRCAPYLMSPQESYELVGDVPNVVFPCASLTEGDKVAIYYGAADTSTCLAFAHLSKLTQYVKENSL